MKKQTLLIYFVVFAIFLRFIPHPPNFVPVTALALFSGSMFRNKITATLLPLSVMFITDLYFGFYSISLWVYLSFLLITVFGSMINKVKIQNVFLSSLIFFIVTNFGVWLLGYPKSIEGLITCYTLAIPFFGLSIIADLFYYYILKYSFQYTESKLKLNEAFS